MHAETNPPAPFKPLPTTGTRGADNHVVSSHENVIKGKSKNKTCGFCGGDQHKIAGYKEVNVMVLTSKGKIIFNYFIN